MLCAKVIDDFLFSGSSSYLQWFDEQKKKRFKVGSDILDDKINFNGATITLDMIGNILLSMNS